MKHRSFPVFAFFILSAFPAWGAQRPTITIEDDGNIAVIAAEKTENSVPPVAENAPPLLPPLPSRKPAVPAMAALPAVKPVPAVDAAPDNVAPRIISEAEAKAVALRRAPPARRMRVFREIQQGRPVYRVVFYTEEGSSAVLVDAFSAEIIAR